MESMGELPVEVVEDIFKYLNSLEDRKSASLVCQVWYRAYLHNYFRKFEVVNITADRHLTMLPKLENLHRKYLHVVLKNVDINENAIPFWERFGEDIKTLSFQSCYIREKMFIKAVSYCTTLESITVYDCKELLMSGLLLDNDEDKGLLKKAWMNLKTLNLSYNRYLSDAILMKLLTLCPSVTSLILTGCQISYHNGMFRKFYPNGLKIPSESVTTFQMVHRYIAANAKRFKTLSLSETLIDSDSLQNLSQTEKLELGVLQLRQCMQVSNAGLIQLCSNLKTLTELDVGQCPRITDTSFIILCSSLPQLTKLSLEGCSAITDMGLANIWQLDRLESLNLSECDLLQGTGIIRGLCYKSNPNIVELKISHLENISECVVLSVAEFLPNLRYLDVASCVEAVTDVTVQALFRHLTWLRYLNLAQCNKVTDCGLTGMGVSIVDVYHVQTQQQLLRVPLGSRAEEEILRDGFKFKHDVRDLSEAELIAAAKTGRDLTRLRGLQHLNLQGCFRVSDVSLKHAFKLTELRYLNLSGCQRISNVGLLQLVKKCPAIESLNLDHCLNVDDDGVAAVVRDLARLRSLVLGSNKVTDAISLSIQNNAVQMTYIDLRHCGQITGEGVGHLFHSLPFLLTFHYPENHTDPETVIPPAPAGRWLKRS